MILASEWITVASLFMPCHLICSFSGKLLAVSNVPVEIPNGPSLFFCTFLQFSCV